jgi:preprotein translocase subunit SecG
MQRETAIAVVLFLLFALVIAMAAPVLADAVLHARVTVIEARA